MVGKKSGKSGTGKGCLILFALPFAGVGVAMIVLLGWALVDHWEMRGWEEVPARIVRTELEATHDDDGTTYRATAEYVYTYGGRPYTGSRVSPYSGSDNLGSFQKDAHRELSEYQKSGKPFRCFVDPDNPAQSILYRSLRWEMLGIYTLFALVFGGVGFGLMIGGLVGWRKARAEAAAARERPDEPWLWKPDWTTGRIRSSSNMLLCSALGLAVFWNLISAPLWFVLPGEVIDKGNHLALLGALFPAVGIGLAIWALREILRWRKYGVSTFEMAEVPGVVGGRLAGVIHTTRNIDPQDGFHVTVCCIRRYTSRSGKDSRTSESILWQDERVMARELAELDYAKSAIPVLFAVPYNQPPTDQSDPDNQVIWRLKVTAEVPGIDYAASFDVPVFKTADSRPDFEIDEGLVADYVAAANPDLDQSRAGVIKTPSPAGFGTRYLFPMARHLGTVLGLTCFFLVWSGVIALMIHLKAPILFPIVFGLFDLVLLFAVLDLWLYRSVVDVGDDEVSVAGGLLGLGRPRRIPICEVRRVFARKGMQSGNTVFYSVVFEVEGGKEVVAGKRLKGKRMADAVIGELEAALGLVDPPPRSAL